MAAALSPRLLLLQQLVLAMMMLTGWLTTTVGASEDTNDSSYSESVVIRPLADGKHLAATVEFIAELPLDSDAELNNYDKFPRLIAKTARRFQVQEFQLSLTRGRWDYNNWQYPQHPAPPGAEVWAWFLPSNSSTDESWAGLTNVLAGTFCSSLNFIDSSRSASPFYTFPPTGASPSRESILPENLRYSLLASEAVCTENLTPWKRLLVASGGRAGLAKLLQPKMFASPYHSLHTHFRIKCMDDSCVNHSLELRQIATVVYKVAKENRESGIRVSQLFGSALEGCRLASSSVASVVLLDSSHNVGLQVTPPGRIAAGRSHTDFILNEGEEVDLKFTWATNDEATQNVVAVSALPITIIRQVVGTGSERGSMSTTIINNSDRDIDTSYLQVLPWIIKVYSHTFKMIINGEDATDNVRDSWLYAQSSDRVRPTTWEIPLTVPAKSHIKMDYKYELAFQKIGEFPPDTHKGYDVGPAVLRVLSNPTTATGGEVVATRIYSPPCTVRLPLPDFSMPYNVIMITSTILAIAFNVMMAISTTTFQPVIKATTEIKSANNNTSKENDNSEALSSEMEPKTKSD